LPSTGNALDWIGVRGTLLDGQYLPAKNAVRSIMEAGGHPTPPFLIAIASPNILGAE
jgi:hypothetical protein